MLEWRSARRAARALADVFFPRFCIFCGGDVSSDKRADACEACIQARRLVGVHLCAKCGAPMARHAARCPNCHNISLAFVAATAYGRYTGDLRDRILEFKSFERYLARTLGALVARAVREAWPAVSFDAVLGVPLHKNRRAERGFDQAEDLAYHTAGSLRLAYLPRRMRRVRDTPSQVGLTRTARLRNVKGAFEATLPKGVKRVLLIDDIMTTGATLSEAARALKRAGADEVYSAAVARVGAGEAMGDDVTGEAMDGAMGGTTGAEDGVDGKETL